MKNIIIVLVIIVIVGLGYHFLKAKPMANTSDTSSYQTFPADTTSQNTTSTNTSSSTTPPPTSAPAPISVSSTTAAKVTLAPVSVAIQNFAFTPASISVKAGTTVTWTNKDSAPHTVTSDSGSTMNSATLATGGSYSVTFTTPGTYTYHCSVHPMMKGTVVVTQ